MKRLTFIERMMLRYIARKGLVAIHWKGVLSPVAHRLVELGEIMVAESDGKKITYCRVKSLHEHKTT